MRLYLNLVNTIETHKNFHTEEYTDGSECVVTGKPRRLVLFYYCDEYAAYQNVDNEKTDLNGMNEWERRAYIDKYASLYEDEILEYFEEQLTQSRKRK